MLVIVAGLLGTLLVLGRICPGSGIEQPTERRRARSRAEGDEGDRS